MANCMRAAARHGVRVVVCDRPNPIGGEAVEGSAAARAVDVVRRAVPDSAAAWDDDWRAGAAVQRRVRHRLRARRRAARRLAPRRCTSTRPACRGSSRRPTCRRSTAPSCIPGAVLFEGTMLSEGRGTTRPFELIGAPVDRRRAAGGRDERAGAARRALPAGVLRADLPEARARDVRRLPAARHRSRRVRAGAHGGRADRRVPARRIRRVSPGGSRPTSTSTTSSRSTSSTARIGCD